MDSMYGRKMLGSTMQLVRGNGSQVLSSCATSPRTYKNDSGVRDSIGVILPVLVSK